MKKRIMAGITLFFFVFSLACALTTFSVSADVYNHPVDAKISSLSLKGDSVEIMVDFCKSDVGGYMYVAIYSPEGKMKKVAGTEFFAGTESLPFSVEMSETSTDDVVKLLFLDSDNPLKPLGKSCERAIETVTIEAFINNFGASDYELDNDMVEFVVTDSYDNGVWSEKEGDSIVSNVEEHINVREFFKTLVNIEIYVNSEDEYCISEMTLSDNSDVIRISASDLDVDTTDSEIYYYESENSSRATRLRLSFYAEFFYNYSQVESFVDMIRDGYDGFYTRADIIVVDNDGDEEYDVVLTNVYNHIVVDSVKPGVIEGLNDYIYLEENTYVDIRNGERNISIEELAQGDVLKCISSSGSTYGNEWLFIENIGKNSFTGKVAAVDAGRGYVIIDESTYKYDPYISIPGLGDYVTVYLTESNVVFHYEYTPETFYGYVISAGYDNNGWETAWELKILDSDGEIYEKRVANQFKIDGERYYCDDANVPYFSDEYMDERNDNAHLRIISYTEDYDGYINKINFPEKMAITSEIYDDDNLIIGENISSNAVVFDATVDFCDEVKVSDLTSLTPKTEYSGYLVCDVNDNYKYIVITDGNVIIESAPEDEEDNSFYGYITRMGYTQSGFSSAWQARIVLADGSEEAYNFAEEFIVDEDYYNGKDLYCDFLTFIADSSYPEDRIYKFTLNGSEEIKRLSYAETYFFSDGVYSEADNTLHRQLTDNASVYDATSGNHEDVGVVGISSLADGEEYDGFVVKVNDKYPIVVITEGILSDEEGGEEGDDEPTEPAMSYGYVVSTTFNDWSFDTTWMVRMLTASGDTVDYVMADKFTIDGVRYNADSYDNEYLEWNQDEYGGNYIDRIVSYRVNSAGKIDAIYTSDCFEFEEEAYNSETNSIASYTIKDNSVVFEISEFSGDTYTENEFCYIYKYSGFVIRNDNMEYDCVVITERIIASLTENFAVVSSYHQTVHTDGSEAISISCYGADGEIHTITFVYDEEISMSSSGMYVDDIKRGSIIAYADDGDGVAEYMDLLFTPETGAEIPSYWAWSGEVVGASEKSPGTSYMFGFVDSATPVGAGYELEVYGDKFDIFGQNETETNLFIESSGNNYFLNERRLVSDSWSDYEDILKTPADDYKFFVAKLVDDEVTDFVLYYR